MMMWAKGSVGNDGLEFLGLSNHLLYFSDRGNAVAEVLFVVNFNEFGLEVGGNTVAEFLYGVNAGSFEEFGKLTCHAFDAEEVGVVDPFEDEFAGNAGSFGYFFAAFAGSAFFKKLLSGFDAGSLEFFGVSWADAFDFFDFVAHGKK